MALWLKILASVPRQQKFLDAGPIAGWLWIAGLGYARETCTDGRIPKVVVAGLVPGLKSPYKHAARLVDVGLWHEASGGYLIHDYLEWNPSKAELDEIKKQDADRKRERRGVPSESDRNPSGFQADASRARGPAPVGACSPSALDSTGVPVISEESARETAAIVPLSRKRGLIDGAEIRRHGSQHAWCDWDSGMCVPHGLHEDFIRRMRLIDADVLLRSWYPTVVAKYQDRAIGDDVFTFWRNEFAGWVGTVTQRPAVSVGSRTGDSMDAAKASLRGRLERLTDGDDDDETHTLAR